MEASGDVSPRLLKPGVVVTWFVTAIRHLPIPKGGPTTAIRINEDSMILKIDNHVVATARFNEHAAADGNGAWIVSTHTVQVQQQPGHHGADSVRDRLARGVALLTDRLIRITTALALVAVAGGRGDISYQHAYELVTSHGKTGTTARLVPFTVDGLIWAASMVVLDARRRYHPVPPPASGA